MRRLGRNREHAASEVIGTVLLISIVVLAGSIIAVAVLSHPQAQKIPALSALISNQSQIVYIKHNGGDALSNGTYEILIDGTDVTSGINKTGSPSAWSIGDLITYTKPGTTPPSSVQIVYTGGGSPVVIAASYFGMLSAIGSITFTPTPTPTIYYNINASASAGGSISPSGTVSVMSGASQPFTITPNYGYSIAGVLVDGSSVGSVSSYTFTNVQAAHNISASFAINTYTITASAGIGGSISPSGSVNVNYGSNQTFTITPNLGYSITSVLVDNSSVGSVSTYTFTNITANHTIAASFAINTYTITASAGTGGTITPNGSVNVAFGGNQTFNITPNTGYSISGVSVDLVSQGAITSYTFTNVQAAHNISASFAVIVPTFTSITPSAGPLAGGQTVTITGTAFTGATVVTFGGSSASFTVNNDTSITATTPAHGAGAVNVVVTTPGGSATGTNAYTYIVAPTFVSISPAAGPSAGGQTVTITGTNFVIGATSVIIGGNAATSVSVSSSTTLTAITPSGSAGAVNAVVTTAGGSATGTGVYTYTVAPTFLTISPATGPSSGGTSVTITGSNFVTGATTVTIDGTAATSVSVSSSTTLTAVTPASSPSGSAGLANVVITTIGGSATGTNAYDYYIIQTFTSSGTSTVPSGATTVQYLVVAGGGGGGGLGGGGGAGGVLTSTLTGLSSSYTVIVGTGGAGGTTAQGSNGGNSVFASITATGGGGGGTSSTTAATTNGVTGGSGGGSSTLSNGAHTAGTVGSGTAGQGDSGGLGSYSSRTYGGGGGGAGGTGGTRSGTTAGSGGAGVLSSISGSPVTYGGGGGGGAASGGGAGGSGGSGGGGAGALNTATPTPGTANTGGGGGGSGATSVRGATGGSGIVILKYY